LFCIVGQCLYRNVVAYTSIFASILYGIASETLLYGGIVGILYCYVWIDRCLNIIVEILILILILMKMDLSEEVMLKLKIRKCIGISAFLQEKA